MVVIPVLFFSIFSSSSLSHYSYYCFCINTFAIMIFVIAVVNMNVTVNVSTNIIISNRTRSEYNSVERSHVTPCPPSLPLPLPRYDVRSRQLVGRTARCGAGHRASHTPPLHPQGQTGAVGVPQPRYGKDRPSRSRTT